MEKAPRQLITAMCRTWSPLLKARWTLSLNRWRSESNSTSVPREDTWLTESIMGAITYVPLVRTNSLTQTRAGRRKRQCAGRQPCSGTRTKGRSGPCRDRPEMERRISPVHVAHGLTGTGGRVYLKRGEMGIVRGGRSHEEREKRDDGRHRGEVGKLVNAVGDELWPLLVPLEDCGEERHQARRRHQRLEAWGTRQGGRIAWTIRLVPTKVSLKERNDILYDHAVS